MKRDKKSGRVLILGIGNDILMDDGIGPCIVKDLSIEFSNSGVYFDSLNVGGLEVMEFIKEYSLVIIIDAIKCTGGKPGDVFYLNLSDFRETCHLSSFHDVSFLTALKLGKKIGYDLPEIGIIAIEVIEDMCFGKEFSPDIRLRYPDIYSEIREFLLPVLRGEEELVTLTEYLP